jgi:hypothetical protein
MTPIDLGIAIRSSTFFWFNNFSFSRRACPSLLVGADAPGENPLPLGASVLYLNTFSRRACSAFEVLISFKAMGRPIG